MAVRRVVRGNIGGAGGDRDRRGKAHLLPSGRGLTREGRGRERGAVVRPQRAHMRAGVRHALVEAQPGHPAAGIRAEAHAELDSLGVAGIQRRGDGSRVKNRTWAPARGGEGPGYGRHHIAGRVGRPGYRHGVDVTGRQRRSRRECRCPARRVVGHRRRDDAVVLGVGQPHRDARRRDALAEDRLYRRGDRDAVRARARGRAGDRRRGHVRR